MFDVPMPQGLSQEAVAKWLFHLGRCSDGYVGSPLTQARAVRALVREKVREAVEEARDWRWVDEDDFEFVDTPDDVVARVMGDQPQAGHDEGRPAQDEAPRA